jgi:hypothetical protein
MMLLAQTPYSMAEMLKIKKAAAKSGNTMNWIVASLSTESGNHKNMRLMPQTLTANSAAKRTKLAPQALYNLLSDGVARNSKPPSLVLPMILMACQRVAMGVKTPSERIDISGPSAKAFQALPSAPT